MKGKFGESLPHFTPCQTPVSSGVNLFAHDLSRCEPFLERICFSSVNLSGSGLMLFEEFPDVMFGTCLGCVSEEILVAADPVLVHQVSLSLLVKAIHKPFSSHLRKDG